MVIKLELVNSISNFSVLASITFYAKDLVSNFNERGGRKYQLTDGFTHIFNTTFTLVITQLLKELFMLLYIHNFIFLKIFLGV